VFDFVERPFLKGREKDAKMCIITEEGCWSLFMLCPTLCFGKVLMKDKIVWKKVEEFYVGRIRWLCINPL
jgi:hypothetical protein